MSTRLRRKSWYDSYHSRSQCECGTMAMRRGVMSARLWRAVAHGQGVACGLPDVSVHGGVIDRHGMARHGAPPFDAGRSDGRSHAARGVVATLARRTAPSGPPRGARVLVRRCDGDALAQQTALAAAALAGCGVAPGDRVLWSCAASLDAIVGLLGALRLGAVVVPVNPSATRSELRYVAGDVDPAVCRGRAAREHGTGCAPIWPESVRAHTGRTPRAAAARGRRRAGCGGARGRCADRVHLGHDRRAKGRRPHPRVRCWPGRWRCRWPGAGSPTTA